MRNLTVAALLATTMAACAVPGKFNAAALRPSVTGSVQRSGVQLANMDATVRPQDDLFAHANGAWLKTVAIPPDRSRHGVDSIMRERSLVQQRELLQAAASAKQGDMRKAGEFYASFMDEQQIERTGLEPLAGEFARINAAKSLADLAGVMGHLDRLGVPMPISSFIDPDAKRSDRYAFWMYGSGLGLPERDYYLSDDPKMADIRGQYQQYLTKLLSLSGQPDAEKAARAVVALETKIARTHWARIDARDPEKTYNPVALPDLVKLSPAIDWTRYMEAQGLPTPLPRTIARQPSTISEVGELLRAEPRETWRLYFSTRLLSAFAPYLPKAFADEQFAFEQRVLQGTQTNPERWKRGVALVDRLMGEAAGRLYVERHFPPEAKRQADRMVANLVSAYERAIERADWMAPTTKAEAMRKLRGMSVKVGHPQVWRSYAALEISPSDLFGNVIRAQMLEADRKRRQLVGPVDRSEWRMTAATVDAYYSPTTNEIAFPAGILQPPLFDPAADDAYNYGSTGATIGHEIGHGFDSRGSRYDSKGNLREWWSPEDRRRFDVKSAALTAQFSAFEPLPGHWVNGKLTLSENMADLAGLEIAYDAYLASLGGRVPEVIDGLTGSQRFFIGYAQSYMGKRRDQLLISQLKINPHSPEQYRVNGIAPHLDAFHEAFSTTAGDRLYLDAGQRVTLWRGSSSK
jgi:predicted metalloendopeptidase